MSFRVVTVNPDGTAAVFTPVPADLPTATAHAAANGGEVVSLAVVDALVLNGVRTMEAEVARVTALLPPDSDGTAQMTVSEYQYHMLSVSEGMAALVPAGAAPTQAQINARVPPFSVFTQKAFDDGLISLAKKNFLDTFGA